MFGPYRVGEVLGEGGMGVVHRAIDERTSRTVALKLLREELSADDTYKRRFLREARTARDVPHPNLVPIVEAGEIDGRAFLASEYMPGGSLHDRLDGGPPLPDDVLRLVTEVAAGLDALHEAGVVHRDVKPANVMFDETGTARLTDFGLAKSYAYTVLTKPGAVMGTVDYLAPEVLRGEDATPASDVYALGCLAYECLSGAPPFGGRGMLQCMQGHLSEEPDEIPGELGWTVARALQKDPAARPPSATAYARLLRVAAR
jgi:serine/threonine-protein kinase